MPQLGAGHSSKLPIGAAVMNKNITVGALVAIVIVAGLGAVYSYRQTGSQPAHIVNEQIPHDAVDYQKEGRKIQDLRFKRRKSAQPEQVPLSALMEGDTRFAALSQAERDWLDRHYYLDQAEIDAAKSIPDSELQRALTDPYAQTILGKRLLAQGNSMGGIAALKNAASHGSVYAYEEAALAVLKDAMQMNGGVADENQILAFRARMEVAKILGDHRADDMFDHYFPGYDAGINSKNLQAQTTELLRQLGENAQLQGSSAAGPDPRPNADIWSNLRDLNHVGGKGDLIPVFE
ncbi:hypothetical protein [Stenotrophomonas sp. 3(2025)]|uniref:hypothetical protein n=1 Tax=Stenotrophomonas sp. 3(2025) TaxID=3456023 RepID=UPI0040451083